MRLRTAAAVGLLVVAATTGCQSKPEEGDSAEARKIPITTSSKKALDLFLEGRELADQIRFTDARDYFLRAIDEDPQFALAYLYLANNPASAKEFFASLKKAVFLAEEVSDGERLWILGTDAGSRGKPGIQRANFETLIELYPEDERAHNLLGRYYFGRREYEQALEHFEQATTINPEFSQPHNLMGYAFRALDRYEDAERSFKRYIQLVPDEPNPYDSYAELLMKVGRHEESIENYRRALEKNPQFLPSYVGIGNNQMFVGDTDAARSSFAELLGLARHDGERRTAHFWTAVSYVFDNNLQGAVEAAESMIALAEKDGDKAALAGDQLFLGAIHLSKGSPEDARASFERALELAEEADVNQDIKATARRNFSYQMAWVAIVEGRLETAAARADEFRVAARATGVANQLERSREIDGVLTLLGGDPETAQAELAQANGQDPIVIYWRARAAFEAGDVERARSLAEKAYRFNQLTPNFAYIRDQAGELLDLLSGA